MRFGRPRVWSAAASCGRKRRRRSQPLGTRLLQCMSLLVQDCGRRPQRRFHARNSRRRQPAKEDKKIFGRPPRPGGVALNLAAKRPLDRARNRSRPIRVTIAPPRTATDPTPASQTETIRTGALVSPACCTVAADDDLGVVERQVPHHQARARARAGVCRAWANFSKSRATFACSASTLWRACLHFAFWIS
jgi:hypothetical protein